MEQGRARHIFPGNNTSIGFFSYYQFILPQQNANHIFCLKGGPGVGKSTFMKNIGKRMQACGYNVEFLHCSSDPSSLDGVLLMDFAVALIDGTAPHVIDPVNPGAVDEIVNLGEFWYLEGIKANREQIIQTNIEVGRLFKRAYKYLAAAKKLSDDISEVYDQTTNPAGAYIQAEMIIEKELSRFPVSGQMGRVRKLFASAITPKGVVHHIGSLIDDTYTVYIIKSIPGDIVSQLLKRISQESVLRGLDTEIYYCPMDPKSKIEHVVIPGCKLALLSENEYTSVDRTGRTVIDMAQYASHPQIGKQKEALLFDLENFKLLLSEAVDTLNKAKGLHDHMESFYIPNMDFDRKKQKEEEIFARIKALIGK